MNSEEILIEFVANGDRANGEVIKSINSNKVKDSIQRVANLVQQLATASSSTSTNNGLALDEVEVALKITPTGEAVLLGDGQSQGAITLRFRRSSPSGTGISYATTQATQTTGQTAVPAASLAHLVSSQGVSYNKLQSLLASQQWQAANQETWNVMCQAAQKKVGSVLSSEDIQRISCEDLQIINNLWQKHSQGRYGFSVQNQIYMSSIVDS